MTEKKRELKEKNSNENITKSFLCISLSFHVELVWVYVAAVDMVCWVYNFHPGMQRIHLVVAFSSSGPCLHTSTHTPTMYFFSFFSSIIFILLQTVRPCHIANYQFSFFFIHNFLIYTFYFCPATKLLLPRQCQSK